MKELNTLEFISLCLALLGGINWGLVGGLNFDLIQFLAGNYPLVVRSLYMAVGIASAYYAISWAARALWVATQDV